MIEKRLFEYLDDQLSQFPQAQAFGEKINGAWQYRSTAEMVELVDRATVGLWRLGLRPGDKVATVVYKTSPDWVALDFALLRLGVLNVPLYPTISSREYAYILNESAATYAVVGDGDLYEKLAAVQAQTPGLREIFSFYPRAEARSWTVLLADDASADERAAIEAVRAGVRPDDLATLIYTSGTTGNPKGVMLTHRNIVYNVEAMRRLIPLTPGMRTLSFLPVSHVFERAVVYAFTAYGASLSFTGTENLGGEDGDLRQVRPHFFTTVPRLLEKVYERIVAKGQELRGVKRAIFFWALKLTDDWAFGFRPSIWQRPAWAVADKLIFSKWRAALGGNIQGIVTGANACPIRIMRTFNAAGILVREGYGLTEAAPALSFCRFEQGGALLGTVGPLLDGVAVRIVHDDAEYRPGEGEIIATSPGIMLGYYKQPEQTAEVLRDIDGQRWLVTGDVGTLVEGPGGRQFLKITDRKKELLKTSGGKYVAPAPLEARLKEHYLVDNAMIVGESRKYVAALIVPAQEGLREWCHRHHVPWTTLADALRDERVQQRYAMLLERFNPMVGKHEQIRRFTLLPNTWEAVRTDGAPAELTPTLKLKRRVVQEKFRAEIEAMYDQDEA